MGCHVDGGDVRGLVRGGTPLLGGKTQTARTLVPSSNFADIAAKPGTIGGAVLHFQTWLALVCLVESVHGLLGSTSDFRLAVEP